MALPLQPELRPAPAWLHTVRWLLALVAALSLMAWVGRPQTTHTQLLGPEPRETLRTLHHLIAQAQRRMSLALYVVHPGEDPHGPVRMLLSALGEAAARGVSIQVVLERGRPDDAWPPPDNTPAFQMLQSMGVPVAWDSADQRLHAKLLAVDDQVLVGSHNWTASALLFNVEASVLVQDAQLAQRCHDWVSALAQAP